MLALFIMLYVFIITTIQDFYYLFLPDFFYASVLEKNMGIKEGNLVI